VFYNDTIQAVCLSGDNSDFIQILGQDRCLVELEANAGIGKGKNSSVFRATDPAGEDDDYVVKFCKYHNKVRGATAEGKRKRFVREIDAVQRAKALGCDGYLLSVLEDSYYRLVNDDVVKYYVMEKAECDLGRFLADTVLSLQQKLFLFFSIMRAMRALHAANLYHRDIKPDNIFRVSGEWKFGDLGFAEFREDDFKFDGPNEKIGPAGLMSPEATNKLLANRRHPLFASDLTIDEKSDIYQLGNVFWFIMQGDIPAGQLTPDDCRGGCDNLYNAVLCPMLQNAKARRPSITDLLHICEPIFKEHGVT